MATISKFPESCVFERSNGCRAKASIAADTGDQSRPIRYQWKVFGTPGQRIISSGGLDVPVDSELADPQRFDYVGVIGGLLDSIEDIPKSYPAFLHQAVSANVPLIGLCTGSFVLARHGLMDGRTACVHAYHANDWKRLFPTLRLFTNPDFLVDKDRITCAGRVSVIELAIHLMVCTADQIALVKSCIK